MVNADHRLFCFGLGYTARALAQTVCTGGWTVAGTVRTEDARAELAADGIGEVWIADTDSPLADPASALAGTTHVLVSAPPGAGGDPILNHHAEDIAAISGLQWVGYLSTTGVYGDTGGAMVDESAPCHPTSERSRNRAAAEGAWLALGRDSSVPVHVFRLAGIYGPGRNALLDARAGKARRIDLPERKFSRIHVDDIVNVLLASIAGPDPGAIYNVADDEPAAPADVTAFACDLLGIDPPPLIPFETARERMSAMALSFWRDNRRIDNTRIKRELGVTLSYPTYREGLAALAAELDGT